MNIRAGLGEYILQTHNTEFLGDSMGFLNPLTPSLGTPVNGCIKCAVELSRIFQNARYTNDMLWIVDFRKSDFRK